MTSLLMGRGVVVIIALIAAVAYLWMYWRNPRRRHGSVSNLLLYLGMVQVFVYGGAAFRIFVVPYDFIPEWVESFLLLAMNTAAMALTVWVLLAYISVQRERRRLEGYFGGRNGAPRS